MVCAAMLGFVHIHVAYKAKLLPTSQACWAGLARHRVADSMCAMSLPRQATLFCKMAIAEQSDGATQQAELLA